MIGRRGVRRARIDARAAHPQAAEADRADAAWRESFDDVRAAEQVVAELADVVIDADPEDRDTFHAETLAIEERRRFAAAELDRVTTVEQTRREHAQTIRAALHDGPIAAAADDVEAADNEARELRDRLAVLAAYRGRREAERLDLIDERDEAVRVYRSPEAARDAFHAEQSEREQVEWFARNIRSGTPIPEMTPHIRRLVQRRLGVLAAVDANYEPVPYEETEAARAAGITRLSGGVDAASFGG